MEVRRKVICARLLTDPVFESIWTEMHGSKVVRQLKAVRSPLDGRILPSPQGPRKTVTA